MSTTSKIGSAGGGTRDYATPSLWLLGFSPGGWIGECYNDTEFGPIATIAFSGHSTSATDFITLRCAAGHSFRDNANVQTNALRYDVSNGVGIKGSFGGAELVQINEDYVTLDGLQLFQSRAYAGLQVITVTTTGATHSVVNGCILRTDGGECFAIKSGLFRNNLVIANFGAGGKNVFKGAYPGTIVFVNNTLVVPSDNGNNSGTTIFSFFGTPSMTFTNNAVFGATGAIGTTTGITGSNNASDMAISFGSDQASKTYANQFVNTTIASGDFKTKALADLLDHGVTDTTDIPAANDIVLTSRPQNSIWDIGCWELVSGVTFTWQKLVNDNQPQPNPVEVIAA